MPPPTRRTRPSHESFYPVQVRNRTPTMIPDRSSWLDGERKRGPTQQDFDTLQSTTVSPVVGNLDLSVEEAYSLADQALKDHLRRDIVCIPIVQNPLSVQSKRKLPFQVFNELDGEFFRSVLKGNVSLGWAPLPPGILSRTSRANRSGNPRIRIELSPYLINHPYAHRADIFAALIHQMVHAYYLQCCGYRDHGYSGTGHGLEHEQPFQALLKLVSDHCVPLREALATPLWTIGGRHNRGRGGFHPTAGVSCCYAHEDRYNNNDIKDWCNTAIATVESLHDTKRPKKGCTSKDNK